MAWSAVTLLLLSVLAVAWQWGSFSSRAGTEAPVVLVVLPLENVSDDPSKEHLGVGFADALISDLQALSGVTVVSRSTGFGYREQRSDPGLITRDLGADFIVDGGVQHVGDQLLVTANLVRPDASVAWADSYQSPQDEIDVKLPGQEEGEPAEPTDLFREEYDLEIYEEGEGGEEGN